MLPLGMLGDRLGRKGILTFMLGFWVVAFLLMGFTQNVTHALVVAGLAGIPFAGIRGVGYAFMLDLIPAERTAEFVGLNYLSQTSSLIFGALVGGVLIDVFGYRSLFVAASLFTLIGVLVLQFVHRRRESAESRG
jgi:DHA1 family multidrug resistance protein-like MFS transporter